MRLLLLLVRVVVTEVLLQSAHRRRAYQLIYPPVRRPTVHQWLLGPFRHMFHPIEPALSPQGVLPMVALKACNGCDLVMCLAGLQSLPNASSRPKTVSDHLALLQRLPGLTITFRLRNRSGHIMRSQLRHPPHACQLDRRGQENELCLQSVPWRLPRNRLRSRLGDTLM
jgi:hypothetical protein